MRVFAAIVFAILLCPLQSVASDTWKVQYGWTSGWGHDDGILITSDGRVGPVTDQLYDQFEECPSDRLGTDDVGTIQGLIDEIPVAVLPNSHTKILDHCDDEREHFVIVSLKDQKRAFQYSQDQSCIGDESPPDWLVALVEHLQSYYLDLKDCIDASDEAP